VRLINISLSDMPRRKIGSADNDRHISLIVTGRAIVQGKRLLAVFYTGKDISFIQQLMNRMLFVFALIGFIFLGAAIWFGHLMSRRAMVPIRRSFLRQREFMADASHELRTPLSILRASVETLKMEEDNLSPFSRRTMSHMEEEIVRMTKLVGDLLTLAREDSGAQQIQRERFDFALDAKAVAETFETIVKEKGQVFKKECPDSLNVYADREKLKQLLYILLDNAVKYTPAGGEIRLAISVKNRAKQRELTIVVADNGIGIAKEEIPRIFERFYRVDKHRARQYGGSGLGLAIAKWIVDAHHGTIEVESEPGKGTTFTVVIQFSS
jgi:signal transduction histidine kinase